MLKLVSVLDQSSLFFDQQFVPINHFFKSISWLFFLLVVLCCPHRLKQEGFIDFEPLEFLQHAFLLLPKSKHLKAHKALNTKCNFTHRSMLGCIESQISWRSELTWFFWGFLLQFKFLCFFRPSAYQATLSMLPPSACKISLKLLNTIDQLTELFYCSRWSCNHFPQSFFCWKCSVQGTLDCGGSTLLFSTPPPSTPSKICPRQASPRI